MPSPLTRLNTPAGTPASSRISANRIAFNGATSDGFSTIVQPAANAGATLQPIWFNGQFHGVIIPHTPTGSRTRSVLPMGRSNSKSASTARAVLKCASPATACPAWASHRGAPISWLMMSASSSSRPE